MNRILIIEDEVETAKSVKDALALDEISADIATDGAQGLEMFKNGIYDLVLLDLKMPGLSGEEVLKFIREEDPFVDVIIYTNFSDFTDIKKLTNIGIEGYINKGPSADLGELITAIKSKLAPLDDNAISTLLKTIPDDNDK